MLPGFKGPGYYYYIIKAVNMAELSERAFDAFLTALRRLDYTGYAEQYPPFGSWEDFSRRGPEIRRAWRRSLGATKELGLFVNVPFCRARCRFCFLPVTAIGSSGEKRADSLRRYLAALDREAALYAPLFKKNKFSTLYIGGGTPSMMAPAETRTFFGLLRRRFNIPRSAQTVLELHPDDVTEDRLAAWEACGVSRVCIGVQSLDERVLNANARRQGLAQVTAAHAALKARGIGVNIDLICGLPGQDRASFLADLKKVIKLRPDQVHLNTFINTPYTVHAMAGGKAGDERAVEALRAAGFRLLAKAGYIKIDSDSMGLTPGSRNRQSTDLSGRRSVLGLGPGAVSRAFGAARYINRAGWDAWLARADRGLCPAERGVLCSPADEMIYSAITKFTDDLAVDLAEFRKTHSADLLKTFPAETAALRAAGAAVSGGKLALPHNMWTLVRRLFYRPAATARGLKNISEASARKPWGR